MRSGAEEKPQRRVVLNELDHAAKSDSKSPKRVEVELREEAMHSTFCIENVEGSHHQQERKMDSPR